MKFQRFVFYNIPDFFSPKREALSTLISRKLPIINFDCHNRARERYLLHEAETAGKGKGMRIRPGSILSEYSEYQYSKEIVQGD